MRLEDVRLYLRDMLREYAALQTFQPFRSEEARCMNWDRMLAEFSAPHRRPSYVRRLWSHLSAARLHTSPDVTTGAASGRKPHVWAPCACLCISACHAQRPHMRDEQHAHCEKLLQSHRCHLLCGPDRGNYTVRRTARWCDTTICRAC